MGRPRFQPNDPVLAIDRDLREVVAGWAAYDRKTSAEHGDGFAWFASRGLSQGWFKRPRVFALLRPSTEGTAWVRGHDGADADVLLAAYLLATSADHL